MAYDFDIVYKREAENRVADALSRISFYEILCLAVSSVSLDLNQQILKSYKKNPGVMKIIKDLE